MTNTTMKSLLENFSLYNEANQAEQTNEMINGIQVRQNQNKFDPFHDYI